MVQLDPHAVAGEAEPSPRKGRSLERAALRARGAEGRQSGTGGVHANGAEVRGIPVIIAATAACRQQGVTCTSISPACGGGPALAPPLACLSCIFYSK